MCDGQAQVLDEYGHPQSVACKLTVLAWQACNVPLLPPPLFNCHPMLASAGLFPTVTAVRRICLHCIQWYISSALQRYLVKSSSGVVAIESGVFHGPVRHWNINYCSAMDSDNIEQ